MWWRFALIVRQVWFFCYWIVCIGGIITLVILMLTSSIAKSGLVTLTGVIISIAFFTQRQKLEELSEFRVLFSEFNKRYHKMEPDLDDLRDLGEKTELSNQQRELVIRYFNLCAEEFLFYKKGLIYGEVWRAWRKGMDQYKNVRAVANAWVSECETGSYYGFKFSEDTDCDSLRQSFNEH